MTGMDRRSFLRGAVVAAGGAAALPSVSMVAGATGTTDGSGPYGPLAGEPDANGLLLPEGFGSRIVGIAGEPIAGTEYPWHVFPDGAATFDDGDDGWWYVCNSEVFVPDGLGGASSVHFDPDGEILSAGRVLSDTTANCAGGPTPWGTWLSCEERFDETGQVWECDPTGEGEPQAHPALGRWAHEAVAVDPEREALYLTQDHPEGLLYRFTPERYPALAAGVLEAAIVASDGAVTWGVVGDPSGTSAPTRTQVDGATIFPGNEGIWYHDGTIVFTSKHDNRVHAIDLEEQRHTVVWDGTPDADIDAGLPKKEPLAGVDNITVEAGSGDLYVAEDGDNMEVVLIATEGAVVPFARVAAPGHETSEITGPVFNPRGDRLYFSSERGPTPKSLREIAGLDTDARTGGVTWEVTGPFRGAGADGGASPADTLANAGSGSSDSAAPAIAIGAGVAVAAAAAGGVLWLRRRRSPAG